MYKIQATLGMTVDFYSEEGRSGDSSESVFKK